MNQFTLLVIILVVFTYYGGSNVPKILRDNKELLLGVVVGLVLCSFLGMRLEGVGAPLENGAQQIVDRESVSVSASEKQQPRETKEENGKAD